MDRHALEYSDEDACNCESDYERRDTMEDLPELPDRKDTVLEQKDTILDARHRKRVHEFECIEDLEGFIDAPWRKSGQTLSESTSCGGDVDDGGTLGEHQGDDDGEVVPPKAGARDPS